MKTDVLVERLSDHQYRVTGTGHFAISVDGPTREDALNRFQVAARSLIPPSAEVVTLDVPGDEGSASADPWAWFAGAATDDPLYPRFLEEVERLRREDEANEARRLAAEEPTA